MNYDPDPRIVISRQFHQACLFAYSQASLLLTDDQYLILNDILQAYTAERRVTRHTYHAAKDILRHIFKQA